jgi:hypothetical protein
MSADASHDVTDMSNRHVLFEGPSARIERAEDGTCHFVETLRDGPLYEIPISRWEALSFLLAVEMQDALNEPDRRRYTANAIAQLVAA